MATIDNRDSFKPNLEAAANNTLQYGQVVIGPEGQSLAEASLWSMVAEYSGSTQYFAEAIAGSDTSSPVWRVRRITYDGSERVTRVEWCDGDTKFDNTALSLSTKTYS